MVITQIQTDIIWQNPQENILRIERLISSAPRSDLFILPEMWSTGFMLHPKGYAEDGSGGVALEWMKNTPKERDAAICGSLSVTCNRNYYNRMYFVRPDGTEEHYDKRHLFSYGGEDMEYTAGTQRTVTEWRGVRFLLQICYDLRFPVFSRNHGEYDAAIYVASWPKSRSLPWQILLKARAIENQCYVAGVNRVGRDPQCEYSGGTMLIDAYGNVVGECPENAECTISSVLDIDALNRFRKKFPVLKDADKTA